MNDLISRQATIDALDEIESEVADGYGYQYEKWRKYFCELPSAQPEPCEDVVSRNAIIQKLNTMDRYVSEELRLCDTDKKFPQNEVFIVDDVYEEIVENLPSAQPDLSGYSDRLWKAAYERGKAEAQSDIIRCRDCKYWREHKYAKETKRYIPFCGFNAIYTKADDFCSRAERRTDEARLLLESIEVHWATDIGEEIEEIDCLRKGDINVTLYRC